MNESLSVPTKRKWGLTNNQLKIIAMISMTLDHVGLVIFPNQMIFRILGRFAFPIYAYMIAEGCRHTRNRAKYLLQIGVLAIICQLVYLLFLNSYYQSILVTFSFSIMLIFAIDNLMKKKDWISWLIAFSVIGALVFLCVILPEFIGFHDYAVDYTYIGVLIPVFIYYAPKKWIKLGIMAIGLVLLAFKITSMIPTASWQWYALLCLPLIALYNGERGKYKMKYMFYIFYPAHLVVIYGIQMLIIYLTYYA